MDKKVANVGEENVNQIFKFYTLHQRDIENSLKHSVYGHDEEPSYREKSIFSKSTTFPKGQPKETPQELSTEPKKKSVIKIKGDKVLDRMARACEHGKPLEFEYWDFGYQSRKELKKSGRKYISQNFKGLVDSIKSCGGNSDVSKTPKAVIIRSTFHENMAKSRVDTKSHRDNESSDMKMETTYGHLLNYRLKQDTHSTKTHSMKGDKKSAKITRGSPTASSVRKFNKYLPILNSNNILTGRKLSVPFDSPDNQENSTTSRGFEGLNLLKRKQPLKLSADKKIPLQPPILTQFKTVCSTE